jgi:predicted nucleotide-binding protein
MSLTAISKKLGELIDAGLKVESYQSYTYWSLRAGEFLRHALDFDTFKAFKAVDGDTYTWSDSLGKQVGMLEGIEAFRDDGAFELAISNAQLGGSVPRAVGPSKRVFVVHGHDHGSKETVARFLERLDLETVILHEKANEGQTVIEKIEMHAEVGFAVVLLTPDDVGAAKADAGTLRPRARQNVILELGYFLGKLKRSRVCALYVPGVEIPSDYQGVLFVELDTKGAWRTQLAQELSNARMPINVAGLLNS